jgi:lysozyme family protein
VTFDDAFALLMRHEGGYVHDPADPGGETYKGVARAKNPTWFGWALVDDHKNDPDFPAGLETDAALQAAVHEFYRLEYWGPSGGDALPDLLKLEMFDLAVNTSAAGHPAHAITLLQRAVGETEDGILGPHTLMAASQDPARALRRLQAYAIKNYTAIPPERRDRFLAGWMNRLADDMLEA